MAAISISISSAATAISPSTAAQRFSSSFSSSNSVFLTSGFSRPLFLPCITFNTRRNNSNSSKRGFSCNCLFGLGVPELVVIAGVAALVFGPKKLPEVGKSIGKTVKSFQQAAKEFESELKKDPEPVADPPPPAAAQKVKEIGDLEENGVEVSSNIKES